MPTEGVEPPLIPEKSLCLCVEIFGFFPTAKEPLFTRSVRLPASVIEQIEASKITPKMSFSDAFRRVIRMPEVEETGRETPSKSRELMPAPLPIDPQLLLVLRGIGNKLNQLTHGMHVDHHAGGVPNYTSLLITLVAIERHIGAIREHHCELSEQFKES
jgi:hypothetical protein